MSIDNQAELEQAVLEYKKIATGQATGSTEDAYRKVIKIYNPLSFYHNWYEQYKFLFDSEEDFIADYQGVFIKILTSWKPRSERKKSRYEGTGQFKNYFIGSLFHNYVNMIKANQAAKRNITTLCPCCQEWVNPLSTHLIKKHSDILWDHIEGMGIDIDSLTSCPFCSSYKPKSSLQTTEEIVDHIKKHIISKHSSHLFHKFNETHPTYSTVAPRVHSNTIDDDGEAHDIYESQMSQSSIIDKLYDSGGLSEMQEYIINQAMNGEAITKPGKYKCTKEEWDDAIEGIKKAMEIHGVL